MFYFCLEKPSVIPKEIICFYVSLTCIQCNPHSVKRKKKTQEKKAIYCDQVIGTGGRGGGVMSGYLGINALKRCSPSLKDLEFYPVDKVPRRGL